VGRLDVSLRGGIVAAWRRDRRPGGTRAEPPRHIAPADWKMFMDLARRNAILASMMLVSERSRNHPLSRLSPAEIDELPLDPQIAAAIAYFMHEMSAEEEAAFEARVRVEAKFFEKVALVAMNWVWAAAVPGPSDGEEWQAGQAVGGGEGWRDYRIPKRGVELMWGRFCEVGKEKSEDAFNLERDGTGH
jgi:hypothetical protein